MKFFLKTSPLLRVTLLVSLVMGLFLGSTGIPVTSAVMSNDQGGNVNHLPSLGDFTLLVTNGEPSQVTGIYADGIFALPVVQQPSGNSGYVATIPNTVTQFSQATNFGSKGFLAHNTLAGSLFYNLYQGGIFTLIYGDGHQENYIVTQIRHFQALAPTNPYSSFKDLEKGKTLSASDLFYQTYGISQQVILQTCIARNGIDSWGRMFIIATSYTPSQAFIPATQPLLAAVP